MDRSKTLPIILMATILITGIVLVITATSTDLLGNNQPQSNDNSEVLTDPDDKPDEVAGDNDPDVNPVAGQTTLEPNSETQTGAEPAPTAQAGSASTLDATQLIDLIISDTWQDNGQTPPWGTHDAPANVGTSYDFYTSARSGFWNDDTYQVFQPWCWVYSPAGTRMSENFKLEMSPAKFYYYHEATKSWSAVDFNGGWNEGTFGRIDGQAWVQTGGTKSLGNNTYDIKNDDSFSFHPWSNARLDNDVSADAALQLVDLRLVDSAGNPVADAKGYQAHCQWDGYAGHGTNEGGRPASYISRAKLLSGDWQTFSSITIPFENPGSNSFTYETAAAEIREAMATHPLVK